MCPDALCLVVAAAEAAQHRLHFFGLPTHPQGFNSLQLIQSVQREGMAAVWPGSACAIDHGDGHFYTAGEAPPQVFRIEVAAAGTPSTCWTSLVPCAPAGVEIWSTQQDSLTVPLRRQAYRYFDDVRGACPQAHCLVLTGTEAAQHRLHLLGVPACLQTLI